MDAEWRRYRIEQAGEYLEGIRRLGQRVRTIEAEVADLRARAEGVGAIDYTRERVSRSAPGDSAAEAAGLLFDALDGYLYELSGYEAERARARRCLASLGSEVGHRGLTRRYLLGWKWGRIAEDMGYSAQSVYRIRDDALCEFYDLMPADARDPRYPAL